MAASDQLTTEEMARAVALDALEAKSITTDGLATTSHDPDKQMDAIERYEKRTAAKSPLLPIRFSKVVSRGL